MNEVSGVRDQAASAGAREGIRGKQSGRGTRGASLNSCWTWAG